MRYLEMARMTTQVHRGEAEAGRQWHLEEVDSERPGHVQRFYPIRAR